MESIERTFTITKDWIPVAWDVCEVVPLFDGNGNVMAYCEKEYSRSAAGIPVEMFSHQMAEIDPHDPEAFAEFMSRYGLLGDPKPRDLRTRAIMDVRTIEDAVTTDRAYHLNVSPASSEERFAWYQAMQHAAEQSGLDWKGSTDSLNDFGAGRMFVTAQEATETYDALMEAAQVAKAMALHNDIHHLAEFLGIQEEAVLGHVVAYTDYLNKLLRSLSPQMDVLHYIEGGSVSKFLPLDEFHERPKREGSLAEAIALQIYQFSMREGNYKECEECGTIFAVRQTKSRKGSPRSSAVFCSDKCRNLNAQHRHRERKRLQAEAKRKGILSKSKRTGEQSHKLTNRETQRC